MNETRPVALHFYEKETVTKCQDLCKQLGFSCYIETLPDNSYNFLTQALTPTERRTFISKWSDVSVERL